MSHMKAMTDVEMDRLIKEHNKGGAFAKQITQAQVCWDSGIKVIKGCGHMNVPKYHVDFEILADEKIKKLQKHYPSLEWLAYLVGKVDHKTNHVLVEDIVIPDSQRVTGANVYDVEYGWNEGKAIIGVIHSHHGMGAFFSGTDDEYINQNHDVSIVVSTNQGSPIKGQVRIKTPCDSYILAEDLTFSVNYPKLLDEDEFEKEFTSKISSYSHRTPIGTGLIGRVIKSGTTILNRGNFVPSTPTLPVVIDPYTPEKELELRAGLARYYSAEEIDDFVFNGEAEEELTSIKELVDLGVDLAEIDDIADDGNFLMTDTEWEVDDYDVNSQDGLHQTSFGVPIGTNEDNVWDLEDSDIVVHLDEGEEIKEVLH